MDPALETSRREHLPNQGGHHILGGDASTSHHPMRQDRGCHDGQVFWNHEVPTKERSATSRCHDPRLASARRQAPDQRSMATRLLDHRQDLREQRLRNSNLMNTGLECAEVFEGELRCWHGTFRVSSKDLQLCGRLWIAHTGGDHKAVELRRGERPCALLQLGGVLRRNDDEGPWKRHHTAMNRDAPLRHGLK